MYDLLLKGGTVIDPAQDLRGALDVAVDNGKIARVAANIAVTEARRVVDIRGKTVTPGLIDLHTHVFDGVAANGVHPDIAGVHAGVTTVIDAGSSGCATFSAFPRHILPRCETEVIPLLHICQTGLATNPDIIAESSIDLESTLRVARDHRGLIKGIMPLMVHIGDTTKRYDPNVIRELLPLLEPGDIVTHLFTANPGGVLDTNGKLVPEAKELAARGVWLDTAHGRMNFGFNVGRRVLDQGLTPHCISTDLTIPGRANTVHSMVEIMARFLGMG